jgi:RNA polymerase sigma-70 factor (ECF subfamily)
MSTASTSETLVGPLMRDLDQVFQEHADLVFGTACEITGRREDGEDVVQTVFLRLLRRGLPSKFHDNPKAYLYRAAINESLNIIRSRRRHPTQAIEDFEIPAQSAETARHEVIHRRLYEAIAELHPVSAEAVILRYVHEYNDAEIAKLLGKSRVTIAVRLHRARTRLKKLLRASFAEEL